MPFFSLHRWVPGIPEFLQFATGLSGKQSGDRTSQCNPCSADCCCCDLLQESTQAAGWVTAGKLLKGKSGKGGVSGVCLCLWGLLTESGPAARVDEDLASWVSFSSGIRGGLQSGFLIQLFCSPSWG